MTAAPAFVLGDSHLGCLVAAHRQDREPAVGPLRFEQLGGGAVAYDLLLHSERRGDLLNPIVDRALRDAAGALSANQQDLDLFVLLGGFIVSNYTWSNQEAFDVVLDGVGLNPSQDVLVVPQDVLMGVFASDFSALIAGLARLRKRVRKVWLVSAPPPHRDNDHIRKALAAKANVKLSEVDEPMHALTRLKVWRLANVFLARRCEEIGIEYMLPPHEALPADGFLPEPFENDGVHANQGYGNLVLRQIAAARLSEAGAA